MISTQQKSTKNEKRKKQRKTSDKIRSAVSWLAAYCKDEESMRRQLEASLSKSERAEIMSRVDSCIGVYRNLPEVNVTLNFLNKSDSSRSAPDSGQPDLGSLVIQGKLPSVTMNVVNLHSVFLPVVTSDPLGPSPHLCSEEIRILLYKIIVARYAPPAKSAFANIFAVQEYDKVGMQYKSRKWIVVDRSSCPVCGGDCIGADCCRISNSQNEFALVKSLTLDLLHLGDLTFVLQPEQVQSSLLRGVDPRIVSSFEIAMITTCYWQRNSSPSSLAILSVLLNMVWSLLVFRAKTGGKGNAERTRGPGQNGEVPPFATSRSEDTMSLTEFLDILHSHPLDADGKPQTRDLPLILGLIHVVTQWQSIFHALCQLQMVIAEHQEIHTVECCFASNRALHEIHQRLQKLCGRKGTRELDSVKRKILDRLQPFPKLQTTFQMLSDLLTQQ